MIKNLYSGKDYPKRNDVFRPKAAWTMIMMLLVVLLLAQPGLAQTAKRTITGKVISTADNSPMPGVSVVVKGTTNGSATDANGNFSLDVNNDDVLVVTFIGYVSQEVPVGTKTTFNIGLKEDAQALNEVVVTGYGELRASDIPSAQTTISSKEIERTVNTTIEQAIQGRAPGVYVTQNTGAPGGGISVSIRGINSINGSNEPLYVIDGVQIQGASSTSGVNPLASLNPTDIESMDILQGPSATAIYGSRGTNGVVLITTKRGKAGDVSVNYSYLTSVQTPPKPLAVMNMREYAQMYNEFRELAGGTVREDFLDPTLLGPGTDWQRELFNNAPMNKHQLSLSGGNENTRYYLSGEYLDQKGVAVGSGFDRASVRLNLDNRARKWLNLGSNFSFAQTNEQINATQSDLINNAIQLSPSIPVRNLDGTYGGGEPRLNPDGSVSESERFTVANPIGLANIITNEMVRRRLLGGLNATVNLAKGLTFKTEFNADYGTGFGTTFLPTYTFGYQRNTIARLDIRNESSLYWGFNQQLQYTNQFGKHSVTALATHESQASKWQNTTLGRSGFNTNEIIDINAGEQNAQQRTGGGQGDWAMESYLGRINYNFGDRYILQGAIRADGSANFGPANRWGYFPSISAAWRVSEEPFFSVPVVSDLRLRFETGLTGNQGSGGNVFARLQQFPTEWGSGFLAANYPNPNFKWEETLTNNAGINLGLFENRIQFEADYYIKKTDNVIVRSSLPWYMGSTGNGSVQAPLVNFGALENKGWSAAINTINMDNGSFRWSTNFNLSHFNATVTQLYTETSVVTRNAPDWYIQPLWSQRTEVGKSPWFFYGFIEEGIFQTEEEVRRSARPADSQGNPFPVGPNSIYVGDVKFRDLNDDGIIDERDMTQIGSPWPKLFGGFTNDFSYKGFNLSVLITGTFGNDVYNYVRFRNANPNNINVGQNMFREARDYARVNSEGVLENPGTTVPRLSGGDVNKNFARHTSKYVEDGSFVRIKNISLNYNLPNTLIGKQPFIKAARVGVSGQNLFTFTKYTGYDPEVGSYVGPNIGNDNAPIGVDAGRYPITPIYSFNIGIDF